jgi:hypothetical protein
VDGGDLVPLLFGIASVVLTALLIRMLVGSRTREKAGYAAGVVVAVALNVLLVGLPGGKGDAPARLVAAALGVLIAVDLGRQAPRARAEQRQVSPAVAAWGIGAYFLTPYVVGVYVARRVMRLSALPRAGVSG